MDRIVVPHRIERPVHLKENAWTNARENVPADRNNSKKSSVASNARLNVRNEPSKAVKTQISREWFQDRNPVRLSSSTLAPSLTQIKLIDRPSWPISLRRAYPATGHVARAPSTMRSSRRLAETPEKRLMKMR